MQFKHPEILWALLLLLIPIFIHLFQLRRFKKTPFTNVKFLQKVISESRRSSSLKKWLLLCTRMLLLAAIIIAFAQPFFAKKTALKLKEMVVYLDDSFSMQAKSGNTSLLEDAVQNFIKAVPENQRLTLFTNQKVYKDVSLKSIQNDLLMLNTTEKQLRLDEIDLKASTLFSSNENTLKNLVVISDFQQRMGVKTSDTTLPFNKHLVRMHAKNVANIAIDSAYINPKKTDNLEITVLLSSSDEVSSTPVSLFNGEKLIAKTAATFDTNKKAKLNFTLPKNEAIRGKIALSDAALTYDNQLYFNIDKKEKIKVLAIGKAKDDFLKRIFTADEFQFTSFSLKTLNFGIINDQNLIVLNELENIPTALTRSLKQFSEERGSIIIIPANEINAESYNALVSHYFSTNYKQVVKQERKITNISFSHPLYENVFEKNVSNFQYPKVNQHYAVKTNAANILSFQDKQPFLFGSGSVYAFTASLSFENSNFKNSPLIVPTFYNIGVGSLQLPELYQYLGTRKQVDIPIKLPKDHILKLVKEGIEFIPQQISFANKVSLSFDDNLKEAGIYQVVSQEATHKNLSFNYPRAESELNYLDINHLNASTKNESITTLFQQIQNNNRVDELWKWFAILAVLFLLVEVLIQKYI